MSRESEALAAESAFFQALLDADAAALERILADDFLIVDVMQGNVTGKAAFLAAVASGQVKFETIAPADQVVRTHDTTAVVVGRTRMSGRFGEAPFSIASRYTHVFVLQGAAWRLLSAQGTPIA